MAVFIPGAYCSILSRNIYAEARTKTLAFLDLPVVMAVATGYSFPESDVTFPDVASETDAADALSDVVRKSLILSLQMELLQMVMTLFLLYSRCCQGWGKACNYSRSDDYCHHFHIQDSSQL